MSDSNLLDILPRILTSQQPLHEAIRHLLQPECAAGIYQVYMLDVTGQYLEPYLRWEQTTDYRQLSLPAIPIGDLNHPITNSYIRRTHLGPFPLHGRVIDSPGYRTLQQHQTRNLSLHINVLQLDQRQAPLGVLLLFDTDPTPTNTTIWEQKLRLFTALLYQQQQQQQKQKRKQQHYRQQQQQAQHQQHQTQQTQIASRFIGTDSASRKVQQNIASAAKNELAILIQGETGCGKDVVATLIHQHSVRATKPFIAVNCAAIPQQLIEAELFGTKKGAYTGSIANRPGLIAAAEGGTLFLDEIGDMPLELQAVLLRVLQQKSYRRLGDDQERQANFRLLCATHAPLTDLIKTGCFRQDLYYRIAQQQLSVPPLRDHLEDIPALSQHIIQHYNQDNGQHHPALATKQLSELQQYDWPGNVRELQNVVLAYLTQTIDGDSTEHPILRHRQTQTNLKNQIPDTSWQEISDLRQACQQFEKTVITHRLQQYAGNRAKAAASLGLPKRTFAHKCQHYAIQSDIEKIQ
jgi:sigma-54-specific transcriptional regulator